MPYTINFTDVTNKGSVTVEDNDINQVVWEYFIPVIIKESNYEVLFNEIKDKRDLKYIDKFNDNSIKIRVSTNDLKSGLCNCKISSIIPFIAIAPTLAINVPLCGMDFNKP